MSAPDGDWPLWEVFVRARRGLSHVHAGSLHAPDAEMALRNARDLYTRRSEGVSIWVVRASEIEASTPRRARRLLRPRRRQGLPPPDVLRRPGRGRAPVTDAPPRRLHPRPRRRRPRLRPADGLVDQPRARARGGRRAGQHRPRPARPGPHPADLRRRARGRGPQRGRPRLPAATTASFRNVKLVERPMTDFGVAMARLLVLCDVPVRAVRRAPRSSRRDPRRGRRQGRQGGRLPRRPRRPLGAAARRRHRRVPRPHAGRPRRRVALRRGAVRRPLDPALVGRAWPSTRAALRERRARRPRRRRRRGDADRARRPGPRCGGGRQGCTPSTSATCWPRCSTSTARTRGRRGDRPTHLGTRAGRTRAWQRRRDACSTPSCRSSPSRTSGSCATSPRTTRDASTCTITPTYSGCPAMETIRADLVETPDLAGYQPRRRRVRAQPRLVDRRRSPREGRAKLARSRHRAAADRRRERRRRRSGSPCRCAARSAAASTPASPAGSARPPARACGSAAPAASPSTTSRPCRRDDQAPVPPAAGGLRRAADRRLGRDHLRRARRARRRLPLRRTAST